MPQSGPIVLVGCGNMGGAMLRGWLDSGVPASGIIVQEPAPSAQIAELLAQAGIRRVDHLSADDVTVPPALILMAVKPQIMDEVFAQIAPLITAPFVTAPLNTAKTIVLSIAAGKTVASFAKHLPGGAPIVRSIPNTPSAIGRGMTVCFANDAVGADDKALCDQLLSALGDVAWVEAEDLIDAATAVSGSGPAYIFHVAEALAEAAMDVGFDEEMARRLAVATVSGAGELLRRSGEDAATLRRNVTSPNGTTQAALEVLMQDRQLTELMQRAVRAARDRSRELSA